MINPLTCPRCVLLVASSSSFFVICFDPWSAICSGPVPMVPGRPSQVAGCKINVIDITVTLARVSGTLF